MALTTASTDLQLDVWSRQVLHEHQRENDFAAEMGTDPNKIIYVRKDLTKSAGDDLWFPLLHRLTGAGVTGDNLLIFNEEQYNSYGDKVTVNQIRNAVRVAKMEQQKTFINFLREARPGMSNWLTEYMRDEFIDRFMSPNLDGTTTYAASNDTQKDAWLAANSDRVLFGAAKSNNASDDHSAALAQIDSTTDVLTPATVSLARRMATDASPRISPLNVTGMKLFILYCQKWAFRDFKQSSVYQQILRESEVRGKGNPLYKHGDLFYDGVLLKEVLDIPVISGVGAGGTPIDVAPNFLCGKQALGLAYAKLVHPIREEYDYGNQEGYGVAQIHGTKKLYFNQIQHGMLTLYAAGVADS